MSDRTKNIIVYSVMAVAIALFIYAVFVGNQQKQLEEQTSPSSGKEQSEKVRSYEAVGEPATDDQPKESDVITEEHDEEVQIDIPEMEKLTPPEGQYADHFSKDAIEASRQAARNFAEKYYPFNGMEPQEHIENARPYMTDEMYQKLKRENPRPTAAVSYKEIESMDVYEPYEPNKEQLIWKVRIQGSVFDSKGNKTAEESMDYTLQMKEEEGTFKVQNYMLNVPY
ncbi:hypothetical protein ACFOGI_15290 [Virgibacillus xinjiangensis]|uniref:Transposase n=1 Tax=Virgibacillus xinjiangensis TaxID=393090 RepID=A0ABV7D074_9BACI